MIRRNTHGSRILGAVLCVQFALAAGAGAASPDWRALADEQTIFALTVDESGSSRETKVWLAVVDDQGFIRTNRATTWGKNVVRNPDIVLRIAATDHPLRAEFIEDEALRKRVIETFRAKYGWSDAILDFIRGSSPHIMRLHAR